MHKSVQTKRLTKQHKKAKGAIGIFGPEAKSHDAEVGNVARRVVTILGQEFPQLVFRHRESIFKKEINAALRKVDAALGHLLFVPDAKIKPDGGIVEVKDDNGEWRVVLVSEAKHQGKDVENIVKGRLVGKRQDQDLMVAGNAIERAHKNIAEMANYMLSEVYFPYVLFLEGSNFLTQNLTLERPDGRKVTLTYNSGALNRLDRLTAANYGMPINTNLCKNKFVKVSDSCTMLQAASIYTQGDGGRWDERTMEKVMLEIARTSLRMLGRDLFTSISKPLTKNGVR